MSTGRKSTSADRSMAFRDGCREVFVDRQPRGELTMSGMWSRSWRGWRVVAMVAAAGLAVASLSTGRVVSGDEAPPNVVLIVADDLGYREAGCFGQEKIRTPRLDALARQGVRLTQHYSGNAVCAPSRCVLMTGKHPGHAVVRSNKSTPPEGQWPLPEEEKTLAELLSAQGYVTGAFGKWGLGGPGSCGDPNQQGIARFFGYNCQAHAHSYYPSYLWSDQERV